MTMTIENIPKYRLPAEWQRQDAVLIAWPHELTDWAPMLDEVRRCYVEIACAARNPWPMCRLSLFQRN